MISGLVASVWCKPARAAGAGRMELELVRRVALHTMASSRGRSWDGVLLLSPTLHWDPDRLDLLWVRWIGACVVSGRRGGGRAIALELCAVRGQRVLSGTEWTLCAPRRSGDHVIGAPQGGARAPHQARPASVGGGRGWARRRACDPNPTHCARTCCSPGAYGRGCSGSCCASPSNWRGRAGGRGGARLCVARSVALRVSVARGDGEGRCALLIARVVFSRAFVRRGLGRLPG